MKVLLIDLGQLTHPNLPVALTAHTHTVETVRSITEAIWICRETRPGVALVCVDEAAGLEAQLATRLRESGSATPLLVVAEAANPADVIIALDAGADDYVARPVRLSEICARVRALGRRTGVQRGLVIEVGDLRCDLTRGQVSRGSTTIALSAHQLAVLVALLRRPGQVVTRAELLDEAWDPASDPSSNVVDQAVAALRRKVDQPFGTHDLQTIRGRGYRWAG